MIRVVLGLSLVLACALQAGEAKKKSAPEPQLAGFGLTPATVVAKHSCTLSYESCATACVGVSGATCQNDCANDCNVCALDMGEDAVRVCSK